MDALRQVEEWPVPHGVAALIGPGGLITQHGDLSYRGAWASVSKLFTAFAVLMAIQDRELELSDQYGPEGATVEHLLSHTSGLPFEGAMPIAQPGSKRIYSNRGFDLLGDLITERTGYRFPVYLRLQILEPLGIDAQLSGRPSQGLDGDIAGLVAFATELIKPTLLDVPLFARAIAVAYPGLSGILPGVGRYERLDWGLGFEIKDGKNPHWTGTLNSPTTFGHFGGSGSFLWVDPTRELALCGLSGRQFGDWAMQAWPQISDSILSSGSSD